MADDSGNIEVEEAELEDDDFSDDDDRGVRNATPARSESSPPLRRRGPSHKRSVVDLPRAKEALTLMQLPPAIDVPLAPSNPAKDALSQDALTTIMYRLKKGVTGSQVESALEDAGNLRAMPMIAESNTRLVTWSDGSRTLMVGNEHFSVTEDKQTPESLYIFQKGKDVQSYYGEVGKYVRVQPSMVSKKRNSALLALSGGPAAKKSTGRTMLRKLDGGDEREEKEKHSAAVKRQREQARRQQKERTIRERAVRPEARLTRRALEDDDDDGDDSDMDFGRDSQRNRWEEDRDARRRDQEREERLRESKRAAAAEERVNAVRRRKLGSRRVLDDDDDDDDDDSDE